MIRVLFLLACAAVLPAQNLIQPSSWSVNTGSQLRFEGADVVFVQGGTLPVLSLTVQIPGPGHYQIAHACDAPPDGPTEWTWANGWKRSVAVVPASWSSSATTFEVRNATTRVLRLHLPGKANGTGATYRLRHPSLRRVTMPSTDYQWSRTGFYVNSDGNLILFGLRRAASPIKVPGFTGALEIDLQAPHGVLAFITSPPARWSMSVVPRRGPAFWLQGVGFSGVPAIGPATSVGG